MAKVLHVTNYLSKPTDYPAKPVCVLFGDESYLKHFAFRSIRDQTLDAEDAEFSLTRFEGASTTFSAVYEEVSTSAMFGGGKRVVVVEDADRFITNNRKRLEDYCDKPSKNGILLILVAEFPSNTNLYKKIETSGLLIDCTPLGERDIPAWIVHWGKEIHKISLDRGAAALLLSLVGPEIGLLDQELAKLSLIVPVKGKVDAKLVESTAGTWRTRKIYDMLDLALDGKTAEAIKQLNNLFLSGVTPHKIINDISSSLRKLGQATQLILNAEKQRQKISVGAALKQVGIHAYYLNKTENQLKQLGRFRGVKLNEMLLKIDMDLKGESRIDPHLILEKFIYVLSDPKLKAVRIPG